MAEEMPPATGDVVTVPAPARAAISQAKLHHHQPSAAQAPSYAHSSHINNNALSYHQPSQNEIISRARVILQRGRLSIESAANRSMEGFSLPNMLC